MTLSIAEKEQIEALTNKYLVNPGLSQYSTQEARDNTSAALIKFSKRYSGKDVKVIWADSPLSAHLMWCCIKENLSKNFSSPGIGSNSNRLIWYSCRHTIHVALKNLFRRYYLETIGKFDEVFNYAKEFLEIRQIKRDYKNSFSITSCDTFHKIIDMMKIGHIGAISDRIWQNVADSLQEDVSSIVMEENLWKIEKWNFNMWFFPFNSWLELLPVYEFFISNNYPLGNLDELGISEETLFRDCLGYFSLSDYRLDVLNCIIGLFHHNLMWWPYDDFVIVCEKPVDVYMDRNGFLHNHEGPGVVFKDGFGIKVKHGELNGLVVKSS